MAKFHGIYMTNLNNETEFIVDILGKMDTWIFQNLGYRSVKHLSNAGTKIWNELDKELKSTSDLKNFRMKLRSILTEKQ